MLDAHGDELWTGNKESKWGRVGVVECKWDVGGFCSDPGKRGRRQIQVGRRTENQETSAGSGSELGWTKGVSGWSERGRDRAQLQAPHIRANIYMPDRTRHGHCARTHCAQPPQGSLVSAIVMYNCDCNRVGLNRGMQVFGRHDPPPVLSNASAMCASKAPGHCLSFALVAYRRTSSDGCAGSIQTSCTSPNTTLETFLLVPRPHSFLK